TLAGGALPRGRLRLPGRGHRLGRLPCRGHGLRASAAGGAGVPGRRARALHARTGEPAPRLRARGGSGVRGSRAARSEEPARGRRTARRGGGAPAAAPAHGGTTPARRGARRGERGAPLPGRRAPDAVVTEAKMRLALLDAAGDPARATAALLGLAGEARTPALRAALLGTAADTAARAGRFDEALGLLGRAATLGPEGAAQADGRRAEILGRWVAALGAAGDAAAVAAVYAAYATDIDATAAPEDALAIARALGRLGLHPSAVRLLELVGERGASL